MMIFKKLKYLSINIGYKTPLIQINRLKSDYKIVFFGSDLFSVKILSGLNRLVKNDPYKIESNKELSLPRVIKEIKVITTLNTHHTNHIVEYCNKNNINYLIWSDLIKNKDENFKFINDLKFDMGFVASFGHLIPNYLINMFSYGILNVHPSLLPRWRGASPIIYSILFNDRQVGVSLMKIMPKHFDIGPLLAQESINVELCLTSLQLLDQLSILANKMIVDLFSDFEKNIKKQKEQPIEQEKRQINDTYNQYNICYAHKITSQMFFVNWKEQTVLEIDSQYRALHEIKHLKTKLNGHIVKLIDMVKLNSNQYKDIQQESHDYGEVKYLKKENVIAIKCKDGFVGFSSLILRKKLTAIDFYNGYMNNRGLVKFESIPNTIKDNIYIAKPRK